MFSRHALVGHKGSWPERLASTLRHCVSHALSVFLDALGVVGSTYTPNASPRLLRPMIFAGHARSI